MSLKSVEQAEIVGGTIALVRADWNVPVKDGKVVDASRIEASAETLNYILNKGGKVIVLSHLGDGADSLLPVVEAAREVFANRQVKFVRDPWNTSSEDGKKVLDNLKGGEIAVLENLRFWMEKENDDEFAQKLAAFGDVYVNEAFPVSHRAHTSIVKLPKLLPAFAGFRFLEEYSKLSEAFEPEHPFLFILGGAKFETKLPLVERFLDIADDVFIGGANALPASGEALSGDPKVILPAGDLAAPDANTETIAILADKIKQAKFVLWNGPLGNYEKGFLAGTVALARLLAESEAKVLVGGGDTLACVKKETRDQIAAHGFISTAGGAMLDFLANGTLPGIEALE